MSAYRTTDLGTNPKPRVSDVRNFRMWANKEVVKRSTSGKYTVYSRNRISKSCSQIISPGPILVWPLKMRRSYIENYSSQPWRVVAIPVRLNST